MPTLIASVFFPSDFSSFVSVSLLIILAFFLTLLKQSVDLNWVLPNGRPNLFFPLYAFTSLPLLLFHAEQHAIKICELTRRKKRNSGSVGNLSDDSSAGAGLKEIARLLKLSSRRVAESRGLQPSHVIRQVLGRHTAEWPKELFERAVKLVDVLNMEESVIDSSTAQLHEVDGFLLG